MNQPVYLGLPILELSKIVMYKFWYDHEKTKYREKAKLCYMDIGIVYIKTYDISKEIAEDVETQFDASDFELDRPLSKGKNKRVILLKLIINKKEKS